MEQDRVYKCKNCESSFHEWSYEFKCQHCDDGITDNVRDIDFDGSGYCKCHVCKGTGYEETTETDFCCEDCIEEYTSEQYG